MTLQDDKTVSSTPSDAVKELEVAIFETSTIKYPQRTAHNAKTADLTVAFAVDFTTRGEELTRNLAGDRYIDIDLRMDPLAAARRLFGAWRHFDGMTLNVAGNSIDRLLRQGFDQFTANLYVHEVIAKVHEHRAIRKIISGGQTGIDLAGGVAGAVLGIPVEMTLPKGCIQLHEGRITKTHSPQEIGDQVVYWAHRLTEELSRKTVAITSRP